MAKKEIINPGWPFYDKYPGSVPGIKMGNLLFISGCASIDAEGNLVGKGDIKAQTRQTMENMKAVLEAAGGSLKDVVATITFITDMSKLQEALEVRRQYLTKESPVTGTGVGVTSLGLEGLMIEINAIAVLDNFS